MVDVVSARVEALYRFPVKGLTPEPLESVVLARQQTFPFDRAYAIENGPGPFDPANPKYQQKIHFVMLMRNEQLAALRCRFDDGTQTLTISRDGARLASGDLSTQPGRTAIERVIADTVTKGLRGQPRIVSSPGHSFSDVSAKCVHIVNLATVRALETAMGAATIDPRRFRPNIVIDGLEAWSELDLVGRTLSGPGTALKIFKRTERCAATNVDPETAARDLDIPTFLLKTLGHKDLGVYARVTTSGPLSVGDALEVTD